MSTVFAQTSTSSKPIDLGVAPPTSYMYIKPGSKSKHTITLEQQGTLPLQITPSLVDFKADGVSGQPALAENSQFRYITLTLPDGNTTQNSFTLNPGQRKSILVNFDVPTDASEGEYTMTMLFKAQANQETTLGTGQSEVSAVVGSNIIALISQTDRDRSNVYLEEIKSLKVIDSLMPLTFNVVAKNSGHNAGAASGSASITNWKNQEVTSFSFYPDMILSGSTRHLRTTPSLKEAQENPETITDQFTYKPGLLIGPYTITATLEHESSEQVSNSSHSHTVLALPISILTLILISLVVWYLFTILSTKYKKRFRSRENLELVDDSKT